jgi:hypothetical protein
MSWFGRWGKGAGDERPEPEPAPVPPAPPPPSGDGEAHLDPRVSAFLAEFESGRFGLRPTGSVDYAACRNAALELHGAVEDEPSRVALLRFHGALMGTGVEGLLREGRDAAELEALWREDYFIMLSKEVLDAEGRVDPKRLEVVNRREREAGRLGPDETFHVEQAPAAEPRHADGAPTARFVGERILALWTVVLRSIAPRQRDVLLQSFAAEGERHWLTDAEIGFLLTEEPEAGALVAFGWQAERLAVLLWAGGLTELPPHDVKCDPLTFAPLVPPTSQVPFETFLGGLRLRERSEIDGATADLDRSYRQAHAAGAEGRAAPDGLDIEILAERLTAAAWLVGQKVPDWP